MLVAIAIVCIIISVPIFILTPNWGPYNKKLRRVNKFREPKNN